MVLFLFWLRTCVRIDSLSGNRSKGKDKAAQVEAEAQCCLGLSWGFPGQMLRHCWALQKSNLRTTGVLFLTGISFCLDFEDISVRDVMYFPWWDTDCLLSGPSPSYPLHSYSSVHFVPNWGPLRDLSGRCYLTISWTRCPSTTPRYRRWDFVHYWDK